MDEGKPDSFQRPRAAPVPNQVSRSSLRIGEAPKERKTKKELHPERKRRTGSPRDEHGHKSREFMKRRGSEKKGGMKYKSRNEGRAKERRQVT